MIIHVLALPFTSFTSGSIHHVKNSSVWHPLPPGAKSPGRCDKKPACIKSVRGICMQSLPLLVIVIRVIPAMKTGSFSGDTMGISWGYCWLATKMTGWICGRARVLRDSAMAIMAGEASYADQLWHYGIWGCSPEISSGEWCPLIYRTI